MNQQDFKLLDLQILRMQYFSLKIPYVDDSKMRKCIKSVQNCLDRWNDFNLFIKYVT